jgi:uncharacterized protein
MLGSRRWTDARGAAALLLAAGVGWILVSRAGPWQEARAATRTVGDGASLLTPEQRRSIGMHHDLLLHDHGIDYRIETVRAVGDLDRWANRRFAELGVGGRSEAGRGLLLVIDAEQDLVRLEVGRALEGVLPDVFVAYVEQRQMEPFFRAGRIGDGILAATELLVGRVLEAAESGELASAPAAEGSAGAGARAPAAIGRGAEPDAHSGPEVPAADSPEDAVAAYLRAMAGRNGQPDLDLYSRATRTMLAGRVLTAAQMDNVARAYRACRAEPARIDVSGERAVVRYPPPERLCAPWLLVREDARWRLDLATASRAIRFGRSNAWHFDAGAPELYAFAFQDWSFDGHGFPRSSEGG